MSFLQCHSLSAMWPAPPPLRSSQESFYSIPLQRRLWNNPLLPFSTLSPLGGALSHEGPTPPVSSPGWAQGDVRVIHFLHPGLRFEPLSSVHLLLQYPWQVLPSGPVPQWVQNLGGKVETGLSLHSNSHVRHTCSWRSLSSYEDSILPGERDSAVIPDL